MRVGYDLWIMSRIHVIWTKKTKGSLFGLELLMPCLVYSVKKRPSFDCLILFVAYFVLYSWYSWNRSKFRQFVVFQMFFQTVLLSFSCQTHLRFTTLSVFQPNRWYFPFISNGRSDQVTPKSLSSSAAPSFFLLLLSSSKETFFNENTSSPEFN